MAGSGLAVFLNGLPGSGKSTVARRLVSTRPGWFLLDVDVLRTYVGGWSEDFDAAGRVIRPIAQAILSEVVAGGGVVVVPQLFFEVEDFVGFAQKARDAGGEVLHVMLEVPTSECWRRLQARPSGFPEHEVGEASLASVLAAEIERGGGGAFLDRLATDLVALRDCEFPMYVIPGDDTERALDQLRAMTQRAKGPPTGNGSRSAK